MNSLISFFDWLLAASLRASVLTLAVWALQLVLRRHISARARYALWLPVLIVLLSPAWPQSRWSLDRLFVTPSVQVIEMPLLSEMDTTTAISASATHSPKITAPAREPLNGPQIRFGAWISVSAALLLFSVFSFLRTLRRFRRQRMPLSEKWAAHIAQTARELGLRHPPQVWCSSAVTSPAVTGLLRPILLLPAHFDEQFTAAEAQLILQHELTHLKRHDLPLNAVLCVLMALHWFNPLLWLAFMKVRADREAACDAQVLADAPPQRRSEYGHALLKAETAFTPLRLSLGFVGLFRRGATLRSRIQFIAHPHQPSPAMKLITFVSISLLTFFGITRAENPAVKDLPREETKLIAIEVATVRFKQDTAWDFDGRFKQLANDADGKIELLSEDGARDLKAELKKQAGAEVVAYPRMVTQDGREVMIRSVVNQPVLAGKTDKGEAAITYLPIGYMAKFTPKAMPNGKVTLDMDVTDSHIVATETIQGNDYPVAASRVYRGPVELKPGITVAQYAWQSYGWKDGKPKSHRPIVTFITTHVLDAKAGGLPADAHSDFTTGKSEFRPGDSIRITNVQRGKDFLTVTADYELASEPEATISLYITATKGDGRSATASSQSKKIQKGKGTVTLHHPAVGEGMPHVSFYPAKGGSVFGGVYFGSAEEAARSQKMKWNMTGSAEPKPNSLEAKLKAIVLPSVAFTNASIDEAVEYLRIKSRALDTSASDPKGVSILVRPSDKPSPSITLDLRDVPLGEALRYVAELAGLQMRVEPFAVVLAPPSKTVSTAAASGADHPITLPNVEFKDATIDEALQFIRLKSRDLDPAKKGVNIIKKPGGAEGAKITISLRNVPVNEALRYIASLAGHTLTNEAGTFVLTPSK